MAFTVLKCPSCNAQLEVAGNRHFCFCEYCGTKLILNAPETTDLTALLERAFLFLEDGDFSEAEKYLERTLDLDPRCAKAYIGKLLCQLQLRDMEMLKSWDTRLTSYDWFCKALRFAAGTELDTYTAIKEANEQQLSAEISRKQAELEAVELEISDLEQMLAETNATIARETNTQKPSKIAYSISITLSIVWGTQAFINHKPSFLIPAIAAIIGACLLHKKRSAAIKLLSNRKEKRAALHRDLKPLQEQQAALRKWLQEKAPTLG